MNRTSRRSLRRVNTQAPALTLRSPAMLSALVVTLVAIAIPVRPGSQE